MRSIQWSLWLLTLAAPLAAQQTLAPQQPTTPRAPVADTGAFAPLNLPDPNEIRRPNGAPGLAYWQQKVDYTITDTLDTAARSLSGKVTIRYANRSPDRSPFSGSRWTRICFGTGAPGRS
jgi:hypothetical protein